MFTSDVVVIFIYALDYTAEERAVRAGGTITLVHASTSDTSNISVSAAYRQDRPSVVYLIAGASECLQVYLLVLPTLPEFHCS